jgi:flagellar biosynthesis regulator FlaF
MTSSPADRVALVYAVYQAAAARRGRDLKAASSDEEAKAVLRNVEQLEIAYLDATKAALDATGPDVEAAFSAAQAAATAVDEAYARDRALPERLRAAAGAVTALSNLVGKAQGG